MNVTIAYIAVAGGKETLRFVTRFSETFISNCPVTSYPDKWPALRLVTICNGGPLDAESGGLLKYIGSEFFPRSNEGWDLGGFCELARSIETDFLVCLGQSVYFHRPGWVNRLIEAREKFGEGMYGIFSSNNVRPHLNTTAFAVDAKLLRSWPKAVTQDDRYQFEHGENSFWRRMQGLHRTVCLVTWDGEWAPRFWRSPHNILWRGDQSNCLVWCIHTERYRDADEKTKATWAANADRPYR